MKIRILSLAALAAVTLAAPASAQDARLSAHLTGAAEKPNAGDADGTGHATFTVSTAQSQVCYDVAVEKIAPATMAHIHKAPASAAGPPVLTLQAPGPDGKAKGCAKADAAVVADIAANPAAYYVNVHNGEFPAGAVRGQLSK
ncbi:MAG: CHRD domain-containing protein [Pseudomonadota bacterium]